jgi:ankyrin repeat protein
LKSQPIAIQYQVTYSNHHTMADIGHELCNLMYRNDHARFSELIEMNPGYDLNSIVTNETLLFKAIRSCKLKFIQILVSHGADIHLPFNDGGDALRKAVFYCVCHAYDLDDQELLKQIREYQDIITYLLEQGANCNSRGSGDDTSLTVICRYDHSQKGIPIIKQIIIQLLDYGADRDLLTHNRLTAEQAARKYSYGEIADCIRDYEPEPVTKGCYMEGQ